MKKRTNGDLKTQRYKDVDMHTRKDAETDSTLEFEFSDSHFRTRTLGLRLSDLNSLTQNLGLELSDSDFRTRTLGLECQTRLLGIKTLALGLSDPKSSTRFFGFGLSTSNSNSRTRTLILALSHLDSRTRTLGLGISHSIFSTRPPFSSATIAIGVREFTNTDTRGEVLEDSETRSEILCPSVLLRILFGDSECENSSPKARVQDFEYESLSLRIRV